jgi:hypothetical protein
MTIRARTNTLVFPTVFTFTNAINGNEVNDDEDTEIEIMRPKRGLDQNEKTNQTPVNEKSGNSESKDRYTVRYDNTCTYKHIGFSDSVYIYKRN